MNTLRNRKAGDKIYYKGMKLTIVSNLGDTMLCEQENGTRILLKYDSLRLPIVEKLNNAYEKASFFRNKIEQRLIDSNQEYLAFLFYSIVVIAAILFFVNIYLY